MHSATLLAVLPLLAAPAAAAPAWQWLDDPASNGNMDFKSPSFWTWPSWGNSNSNSNKDISTSWWGSWGQQPKPGQNGQTQNFGTDDQNVKHVTITMTQGQAIPSAVPQGNSQQEPKADPKPQQQEPKTDTKPQEQPQPDNKPSPQPAQPTQPPQNNTPPQQTQDSNQSEAAQGGSFPPASGQTGTGPASAQQEIVDLHNKFRAQYGAGPLVWNQTLAGFAADWSKGCKWKHTDREIVDSQGGYGQNMATRGPPSNTLAPDFEGWAKEASLYDYNKADYDDASGHFTQVVWKDTTSVGCSWTTCPGNTVMSGWGDDAIFLVCDYYPRGNMRGGDNFAQQVGKKI